MNIPTKRFRSYYRALKRQESWAIKLSKLSKLEQMFAWLYRDHLSSIITTKNPFLALVRKNTDFFEKYFPAPVLYKTSSKRKRSQWRNQ